MAVRNLKLFALMIAAGTGVVAIHDYAYRRVDIAHVGDYELGGLLTHAGTDMVILTLVLATVALLWANQGPRQ